MPERLNVLPVLWINLPCDLATEIGASADADAPAAVSRSCTGSVSMQHFWHQSLSFCPANTDLERSSRLYFTRTFRHPGQHAYYNGVTLRCLELFLFEAYSLDLMEDAVLVLTASRRSQHGKLLSIPSWRRPGEQKTWILTQLWGANEEIAREVTESISQDAWICRKCVNCFCKMFWSLSLMLPTLAMNFATLEATSTESCWCSISLRDVVLKSAREAGNHVGISRLHQGGQCTLLTDAYCN